MAKKQAADGRTRGTQGEQPLADNAPDILTTELVPPATEEEKAAAEDGLAIRTWSGQLAGFFVTAQTLEVKAKARETEALALVQPTTLEQDERIVAFIRGVAIDEKALEAHWTITALVSRLHRRLTGKREIAARALTAAKARGNALHNAYAEGERRRVAREAEEERVRKETAAREEQARESARLEAEAVKLEEASAELSERERQFVEMMVSGPTSARGNGTECARIAGFKKPLESAARLISLEKIQTAITAGKKALDLRTQATAKRAQPVEVEVATQKAQVAGGGRTTWSGEVLDVEALVAAVISGKHGIPSDVLTVNQTKLNDYARSLHERLDLWPGVRAKKTTGVV